MKISALALLSIFGLATAGKPQLSVRKKSKIFVNGMIN
jgi:hypothetical protein